MAPVLPQGDPQGAQGGQVNPRLYCEEYGPVAMSAMYGLYTYNLRAKPNCTVQISTRRGGPVATVVIGSEGVATAIMQHNVTGTAGGPAAPPAAPPAPPAQGAAPGDADVAALNALFDRKYSKY